MYLKLSMSTAFILTLKILMYLQGPSTKCLPKDYIELKSKIFGRSSKGTLTKYQESINRCACELCIEDPNLLNDRKTLLELSRKKLNESGYIYKKGKSRSKLLSSDEKEVPPKRARVDKDVRLTRIAEIEEEIEDKDEQIKYKELRRDSAKNMHNYKECDTLTDQISCLKSERRFLKLELANLTKKQKKADWHNARKTPTRPKSSSLSSSPEPRSPSSSLTSFKIPKTSVTPSPTLSMLSCGLQTQPLADSDDTMLLSSSDEYESTVLPQTSDSATVTVDSEPSNSTTLLESNHISNSTSALPLQSPAISNLSAVPKPSLRRENAICLSTQSNNPAFPAPHFY